MPPETEAIRPTLFIGLGGTGKEVLLRLRRRFYERWRKVGLPCVKYLWIDTDTRDVMAQGEKLDEIDKLLLFRDIERIGLLNGSVGADLGDILNQPGRYGNIHEWIPDEVESYGTQVADGAGGVRSIGRLALFKHFPRLKGTIQQLLNDITTDTAIAQTRDEFLPDVGFDQNPRVYVIFSVAGGTGGGTFLDVAFLLQQMRLTDTAGIAVLPNVYHDSSSGLEGKRSLANAYGAMKEIEHFTQRLKQAEGPDGGLVPRDLDVKWSAEGPRQSISGPPFSVLYLCEKIDDRGKGIGSRHQLFHMIAESLFVNFLPGQLSSAKRSAIANVRQHLSVRGDKVEILREGMRLPLTQVSSRRYGSMGMGKIEVPTESIREACAANLGADIIRYWNRPSKDPNLQKRVDDDAVGNFDIDGIESLFGKDYESEIANKAAEVLPPGKQFSGSREDTAAFLAELEGKLDKAHAFLFSDSQNSAADWGRVKSLLHNSVKGISDKLEQKIYKWAGQKLDTEDLGLAALVENTNDTKGLLPLLRRKIGKIYEKPDGKTPSDAEARAIESDQEADHWKQEQRRFCNEMMAVNAHMSIGMLGVRSWTLERTWKNLCDAVEQHWKWRGAAILAREASIVAERSEKPLETLFGRLTRFRNSLEAPQTLLATLQDEYLDFSKGVRSVRIFDKKADYPRFYRLGFDEQRKEHLVVNPAAEGMRFAKETIKDDGGTMDIVEFSSVNGIENLVEKLRSFTTLRFQTDFKTCVEHTCPRMVEVLTHPQSGGIDKVARDLVDAAAPMLRTGQDSHDPNRLPQAYLSVPEEEGPDYKEFIRRVNESCQDRGYGTPRAFSTGDKTKIQLLIENYAFPLDKIPAIVGECESEYSSFYQQNIEGAARQFRIPLHINKQWEGELQDIVPLKEEDGPAYLNAMEILSMGPVLGVIRVQMVNSRRQYLYGQWKFFASQDEALGPKRQAIKLLIDDRELQSKLLKEIQSRHAQKLRFAASSNPAEKKKAIEYAWALAFVRTQILAKASPELAIMDQRLAELAAVLKQDMPIVDDASKLSEMARAALGDDVTWQGGFPMLDPKIPFVLNKPEYPAPPPPRGTDPAPGTPASD